MNEHFSIKEYALIRKIPIISDAALEILLVKLKEVQPERILEIGTAIGYSGCQMLSACPFAKLVTVEINPEACAVAKEIFVSAGFEHRVQLIEGDVNEVIGYIGGKFGFILLDGPKGHYEQLRPYLTELLEGGGVLFADNILFKGYVNNGYTAHKHRTAVNSLEAFIKHMQGDKRFIAELLNIGDGILIAYKKVLNN